MAAAVERSIQQSIRNVVESLETRFLFSVALDANGWTQVTPTPGVSKLIYVSSSSGSDTNSGLSSATPVATIARAVTLLRNHSPDWILLDRGDTFKEGVVLSTSGLSVQEPMVFTYYGNPTLPRPVVDSGTSTAMHTGQNNDFVDIIGINFTSSTHNPTSPNYLGASGKVGYGLSDSGTSDMLVEDCSFSYFIDDVLLQPVTAAVNNVTIRRNEVLDAYFTGGNSEGMYSEHVNGLTIQDNIFDHDGWNSLVPGGGPTGFNHDAYIHQSNNSVVITGNVFADASSVGLEARAGGIVDDNFFVNDPYGLTFGLVNGSTTRPGGVTGEVIGNVIIQPRVDTVNTYGIAMQIGNLAPGGNTVIANNIIADSPFNAPAIEFTPGNADANPQQEAGLNSVTVKNNTTYNWGYAVYMSNLYVPGTTGADGLTGVVITGNNFQDNYTGRIVAVDSLYDPRYETWSGNTYSSTTASSSSWFRYQTVTSSLGTWKANIEPTAISAALPFVNPNVTIQSYMASLGMPATLSAFVAGARASSATNWNPIYFASAVNSYIQAGFSVDSTAPTAVVAPPPDVTPLNFQTTPSPTFTITYTDDVALNAASISNAVISVTGTGGVTLPVSLVGTTGSGTSITATYQVSAPVGDWTMVPDGTYVIALAGGQVADTSGNTIAGEPLGTFQVALNDDTSALAGPATTPANFAATAGTSSISLSWNDPAADQFSYLLQRADDSNFTQNVQNLPLTADAVSYTDSTAVGGHTYYYQLTAINPLGASLPTTAASAVILPPAPVLSKVIIDDGNANRAAITSATLIFSTQVEVDPTMISLVQTPLTNPTPVTTTVSNPTGDGRTWVVSSATGVYNNALPDGPYSLTVHGGLIADAFGQTAGGDQTTNFTSADGPVITAAVYNHSGPPHSLAFTFSTDVSASLSLNTLRLSNPTVVIPAASYSWNPATLTATWTLSGALPDNNYRALLASALITNSDGVHLDGNRDGIPGDDYALNFTEVKPTLTASGNANVNVNAPYTLTLGAITDAGQTSPQYLVHWGDGSTSTYSSSGKVTHTYSSALGATSIVVDVLDANGTHPNCATVAVSVNHPTIAVSGNANANPGANYSFTLGTVTDTGFTVSQYIVHWGDGTSNTYTTTGAKTHAYSNGTSAGISDSITVDLVDNGGASGASFTNLVAATKNITLNPLPTIAVSGALNMNVSGVYRLTLGPATDPGFTVSQLVVNWGDGSSPTTLAAGSGTVTHTFTSASAPNTDLITVDLTDNSGTYKSAGQFSVTVNPRPTVALAGASMANAGGGYSLTVSPAVDAAQTVSQYKINWGDNSAATIASTAGTFNHVFASAGNPTITVDVTDGSGVYAAAGSLAVTVNGPPTVAVTGNANANAGGTYALNLGAVTDPGQTASQFTVHWGDNTSNVYTAGGAITHTYGATGAKTISVDLTDGTGTFAGAGTLAIKVSQPTVALTGSAGVFLGQSYSLTLNPPMDLGGTPQQYIVHWGDSTSTTYASVSPANSIIATHTYSATTSVNITADLVDETGTFVGAGSLPLTIAPLPTVNLQGSANANVGGTYTLNIAGASDAIGSISSFIVHWGDNTTSTASAVGSLTHVYTSAGPASIVIDTVDQNGTDASVAALALTVSQPAVTLAGGALAALNQPYALSVSNVFDPGQTITGYTVHWGDGNSDTDGPGVAFAHTYAATGPMSISVDLTDGAGTYVAAGTLNVAVANGPSLTLSANANANAGGAYALTLASVSDPDGTPSQYIVHWGDGQTDTTAALGSLNHTYTTPGSENIAIDVVDSAGTWQSAASATVNVNAAPTIALSGNANANMGGTYMLNLGSVTDPGYAVSQYTVNWGDGTSTSYGTGGAAPHMFMTPGPANIAVTLTDATGSYSSAGSMTVNVNSPPTIALSGNANANVGGTYALTLGAVTDPGYSVSQYTVHWGDGSMNSYAAGGVVSHTFSTAGPTHVTVDLTDATGTYTGAGTLAVAVNAAPKILLSGNANANVGGTYALNLGTVTDPGNAVSQYTVHWGDGSTSFYVTGGVVSHTFSTVGAKNVTVDLTDATGTFTNAGTLAVTANAAPKIALSGASTATVGTAYSLTLGAVADPGYTASKYTVHWGDGNTSTYSAGGVVTHTYPVAQSAGITVDLTDSTGTFTNAGAAAMTVSVAAASTPGAFTNSVDIGSPKLAGSASSSNGTYTVTGSGTDIWNTSDQFHYDYKNVTGNTTITATVTGVQNTASWAKAGVMIRNGTAANAAFADIVVSPAGYLGFQYRTKAGAACSQFTLTGKVLPQSVKLVRNSNTFSAYYLSKGVWTQLGKSVTISMNSSVTTGLAVASMTSSKTCTATFTGVSVA